MVMETRKITQPMLVHFFSASIFFFSVHSFLLSCFRLVLPLNLLDAIVCSSYGKCQAVVPHTFRLFGNFPPSSTNTSQYHYNGKVCRVWPGQRCTNDENRANEIEKRGKTSFPGLSHHSFQLNWSAGKRWALDGLGLKESLPVIYLMVELDIRIGVVEDAAADGRVFFSRSQNPRTTDTVDRRYQQQTNWTALDLNKYQNDRKFNNKKNASRMNWMFYQEINLHFMGLMGNLCWASGMMDDSRPWAMLSLKSPEMFWIEINSGNSKCRKRKRIKIKLLADGENPIEKFSHEFWLWNLYCWCEMEDVKSETGIQSKRCCKQTKTAIRNSISVSYKLQLIIYLIINQTLEVATRATMTRKETEINILTLFLIIKNKLYLERWDYY